MPLDSQTTIIRCDVEVCYVLLGEFSNGLLHAKMSWRRRGSVAAVNFDGARALEREERYGDVVGFFHTHPEGFVHPSDRDDRTMRAWSFAFGKPLACIIGTTVGLRAWIYDVEGASEELERIALFKKNWLVGALKQVSK